MDAKGRRRQLDVADDPRFPGNPLAAYGAWLTGKLSDPNSGVIPLGAPRFVEISKFAAIRKSAKYTTQDMGPPITVAEGDTLESIALSHDVPADAIIMINDNDRAAPANPNAIKPGQTVFIPASARTIKLPSIEAVVKVRVVNADALEKFLSAGIGHQKAFGYGSILPSEVLSELDS
jgi:hypothetical protein